MSANRDSVAGQASDPINALTSGYAERYRAGKPLAFLQAFTDDSASETGDKYLVLAGYLASAENWASFADSWDRQLHAYPSIDYFKMSEANFLSGEFRGWTKQARDEKLEAMAAVIAYFDPVSFSISISRARFASLVAPLSPRGINPHFTCTFGFVSMVARYLAEQNVGTPVDFIFDEQDGVSADIALFFEYMKRGVPAPARRLIGGSPIFRNDRLFLPLQAADMLAWHVRREKEMPGALPMANTLRSRIGHVESEVTDAELRLWSRKFAKMPATKALQSKSQWRRLRSEVARLAGIGYAPPHGTRMKNSFHASRERIRALLRLD